MLPFENLTADYVKETGNHVMYRVTPVFEGGNLVASGVLMEAESVEDQGEGVLFCVYVYNVQPGIAIDYATGESWADGSGSEGSTAGQGTAGKWQQPESIGWIGSSWFVGRRRWILWKQRDGSDLHSQYQLEKISPSKLHICHPDEGGKPAGIYRYAR